MPHSQSAIVTGPIQITFAAPNQKSSEKTDLAPRGALQIRQHLGRALNRGMGRICLVLLAFFAAGCAVHDRTDLTPTATTYERFEPVGAPADVRTFGDISNLEADEVITEFREGFSRAGRRGAINILALSGGGPDGAYGAGVLSGWTATGRRPEFDIVTGISTGAIIAPFAFLGSDYDASVRRFYTTTDTKQVATFRVMAALLGGGALADNAPLAEAIARELTDDIILKIAEEHRKGRRLVIGTTNFDAERPVLWDIGALADARTPAAFELVRKVILASAAIPVVFTPVRIPVTDGEIVREELHVDGALTQQIFTYPGDLPMRRILADLGLSNANNTVWLIHNKRLEPRFEPQSTKLVDMSERTLSTLIRSQGFGDLAYIIALAKRDGFQVNGLVVPPRFDEEPTQAFDPVYMSKLYNVGVEDGSDPNAWRSDLQDELFNVPE
ncbi:patatin-like phospholipase family protein [Thalassococcus sp. S3]|uniref:patatin-like phospholipase family protein n=1 Tax=Thalassococcus sp. S3 TaxID=2017482 RepID=UPI0010246189|nr:patatin-like phospholipase family protein [Thalassococcus sp. S3]QBF31555.1 patatin [Thalassococcus sp. S3]